MNSYPDESATKTQRHTPSKAEWVFSGIDIVLLLLLSVRLFKPDFLDGQLLPSMALALLPGTLLTLLHRKSAWAFRMGFALGLIVFLVWNGTIDPHELLKTFRNWQYVIPGLLLMFMQIIIGSVRWDLLLRGQGARISMGTLLRLTSIGCFFSTFIPGATGGDFYRIYRVAREGCLSKTSVATSVVLERFLGMPMLLILILLGVALNYDMVSANEDFMATVRIYGIVAAIMLVGVTLLFFGAFFLNDRLERIEHRIPGGKYLHNLTSSIAVYRNKPLLIILVLVISIVSHLLTLVSFLFFAKAAQITGVDTRQYLFLVFAALTVNYIPLTPGGIGQGETAFSHIFEIATPGLGNGPKAASMMLCFRAGMLMMGMLGGILYSLGKQDIKLHSSSAEIPDEDTQTAQN